MNGLQERVSFRLSEKYMEAAPNSENEVWYLNAWAFLFELYQIECELCGEHDPLKCPHFGS